jgi:hypothetical protein
MGVLRGVVTRPKNITGTGIRPKNITGTGIRPKNTVIRPNKSNIVNLILIFNYIPAGSFQIPHMI